MAEDPSQLQREIDAIRRNLTDVAQELEVRLAEARRRISLRYVVERHPVAIVLAAAGLVALVALTATLRRHRIQKIARTAIR